MKKALVAAITALVVALPALAAPKPNYGGLTKKQEARIIRIITARFGSASWMAICIARRESGLNPKAANWGDSNGGSHGLFQINGIHSWAFGKKKHSIYNAYWNTEVAWRLSRHGKSWGPWGWAC